MGWRTLVLLEESFAHKKMIWIQRSLNGGSLVKKKIRVFSEVVNRIANFIHAIRLTGVEILRCLLHFIGISNKHVF
jgi:hypothetical protein